MRKKIISVLISLMLIILTVVPAFTVADAAVWTGGTATPSVLGGVYQIATAENLAWFAGAVNNGNSAINGILTADIQLNSVGSTSNKWIPIGTNTNPYCGMFDGNGHTVSGVCVTVDYNGAGFFGCVAYPENTDEIVDVSPEYIVGTREYNIKNLKIVDASVSGKQNVGGIVGYASNAGLLNCSFSGTVTGTENSVGGIAGWVCASSVVSECCSTGVVTGHQRTGGVVGYASGNAVITKCYSNAPVTGYTNVGGIVGTLSSASAVGAFFLGSVTAKNRAGGLAGYSAFGTLKSAYAVSEITSTDAAAADLGGAVGVIYGGTYASVFYDFEISGVDGPEGIGRTVSEMKSRDFVKEVNRSSPYFCYDYTNINNGYPVLTWMLQLDVWTGDRTMPQTNSSGTYLISKPSELAWFAALVNGTLSGFAQNTAANATVTDDLLFNIDVYDDSTGLTEWTPIGTASSPYSGTFNGAGYNIAGIYTNPASAGDSGMNVGLFGYTNGAKISNTVVLDGLICGRENVGGIVGYMFGGSVTSCLCDSEICGDRAVGGIAGNINSAASVTTCGMMGTVTGTNVGGESGSCQNVGGVVGYNNRAVVTKSFASAYINAPLARWAGGIVGYNSSGTVTSCYSTSTVEGYTQAGGIAGYYYNGTIQKCYTAGKVTSMQSGIAFGLVSGTGISYCFYDSGFRTTANTESGATAKLSTQMTGAYATSNMYIGSDFTSKADDTYFYYYPQISSLASSSITSLKNASLESVKRVQGKYIARVEIDGRTDTYYETLPEAFSYAAITPSTVLPTVFLVRDYELADTLTISAEVEFYGENRAVLTRGASLTNAMINITGNVTIGSSLYGDDSDPQFFLEGAEVAGTQSAILVSSSGNLIFEQGVTLKNCKTATTAVQGAAVNVSGSFTMKGGLIADCTCRTVGGAIYGENAQITVSGGTVSGNTSLTQGGAIYNNNGTLLINGGSITGNTAENYGGAVACYGEDSETVVSGDAVISQNIANFGGAFSVRGYGTLKIDDGTITGNRGYNQGGAIYIEEKSNVVISGGLIYNNTAASFTAAGLGSGIYDDGNLELKGAAKIDSGNDVYLTDGKIITINERLTCSGCAATVTPSSYSEGKKILDGQLMSSYYSKIDIPDASWRVLASGKLTSTSASVVCVLSKNQSYSVDYITLADAFAAVGDEDTANITVVADNIISEVIPVHGDVTIICDDTTCTATRDSSFVGVMFDVQPGATLHFGDMSINSYQQAQSDYKSGIQTAGQFILDGGGIPAAAAVNVQSGGIFCMFDDAIIQNCSNPTTSAVTVSGTMEMYGGTLRNNTSAYGGAVYVAQNAFLNLYGGVIAGNTSSHAGDAVYSLGKVTRNIHSYKYYYIGSYVDAVTGETVLKDPEFKVTAKTDILIAEGEAVYVDAKMIYIAENESNEYTRYTTAIPTDVSFTLNKMTVDLKTYKTGNIAVTGTKVINYYIGFVPYVTGYCILSNGALGLNGLVPKSTSGMKVDRSKNTISGIIFGSNTVTTLSGKFENDRSLIKIYSAEGRALRTSNTITTGCVIKLVDTSGNVIDTVTVVVYGDVNADEIIDARDAVLINAIAGGMLTARNISPAKIEAADVNSDGNVTAADAASVEACGVYAEVINQTR